MKSKVQGKQWCDRCGKSMAVENVSKARYTLFVLWRCSCGHQRLEKKHEPATSSV